MKLKPEDLAKNNYIQLDILTHKELAPFIRKYMKEKNKYSKFFNLCIALLLLLTGYLFLHDLKSPGFSLSNRFTHLSYGIAIAFTLIPLHEYIHVLAYRSQGAVNTSYAANLKKFYFMALADKFVANKKEFEIVALAPFFVITTILLVLFFIVNPGWILTIAGILLVHTAMCSGDFGLLNYFEFHKDKQVVTYDDAENQISYFYGQITANERSS
jgi:hypothetical protein